MTVEYINPDSLPRNPAYTNVVVVSGNVKTIYIGAQTEQVLNNIDAALCAAGDKREHIIKWNIYLVQGQPVQPGVEAFQRWWGDRPNPPANTVVTIAGTIPPDFLVAIEAIAVVPA